MSAVAVATDTGVPLADLTPRPGVGGRFRAGERIDPFWDGLWSHGSSASWTSAEAARRQVAAGLARLPAELSMDEDEAVEVFEKATSRGERLALLAAVDQWRTCTVEQAAAITGWSHLGASTSRTIAAAFTLGLVDVGQPSDALRRGPASSRVRMVRPSRGDGFARLVEPDLSYQEWVSVTAGYPWVHGGQYDRHNLLSTELGLRVAEFCEVGTVLGEKVSRAQMMAWAGRGGLPKESTRRSADLTVVRTDGLRVAVEVTTSASPDLQGKARRWAQLLSSSSLAASGLVVLFVVVPPAGGLVRSGGGWVNLAERVRSDVARVVREYPGTAGDRVAARMAVASWTDWFPARHAASEGFLSLDAWRPTGPPARAGEASRQWEPVSVLDPFDMELDASDPGRLTAVVANAGMLLGVPHWLRSAADAPQLWPLLMRAAGLDELPVSTPSRPERATGERAAVAAGIEGITRPPDRMRVDLPGWPGAVAP